jgi:hypothetical protein
MTQKTENPPSTETRPQATQPDESTVAVCEKTVSGNFTLQRRILHACLEIPRMASYVPDNNNMDVGGSCLARAVANFIRTYFADAKTGLEIATYVRFILLSSGYLNADSLIQTSVYSERSCIPATGSEFDTMSRNLGSLVSCGKESQEFSVQFRPVTAYNLNKLNLRGIVEGQELQQTEKTARAQLGAFAKTHQGKG